MTEELFDADGLCFVQFFGERKPRKAELDAWRTIIAELAPLGTAGVAA